MTTTDQPELPPGIMDRPQGEAPLLDDLSIRELRIGNAKCRADIVTAIQVPTADRWDALAIVGWLWHKRRDPQARLEAWTDLTAGQLSVALGLAGDQEPADVDQGDDGPDDGPPAPWTDDLAGEFAARPTDPAP